MHSIHLFYISFNYHHLHMYDPPPFPLFKYYEHVSFRVKPSSDPLITVHITARISECISNILTSNENSLQPVTRTGVNSPTFTRKAFPTKDDDIPQGKLHMR